jgi:hypothetical protein
MKEIYKNPILYYIFVPLIVALWPLFVWGMYLPRAQRNWQREKAQYEKAQTLITEILTIDPGRLGFSDADNDEMEFDYARAIERVATSCRIPPASYRLSSGMIMTSSGQKSQSAKVVLKEVDITRFAKFLSTIQLRWENLQCTKVKLTKNKGLPDSWDMDLDFKYYY